MNRGDFSIICGDGKLLKVPWEVLRDNSDYFRALFDSRMTESRERTLDLRPAARDIFARESAFKRRVLREIFLPRKQKSALSAAAEDLLFAAGYFQASGWMEKLKTDDGEGTMGVASAIAVLPHARQCGLLEIHRQAENAAVVDYNQFLRLSSGKGLDDAQLAAIEKRRLGADRPHRGNFTVILQTDVCLDDSGYIRRSYALIDFRQGADCWSPLLVDRFSLRRNETVVQALAMRNYLHVVTSQYCWRMRRTRLRVYSFNPFAPCPNGPTGPIGTDTTVDSGFLPMGPAWDLESDELTKPGYVQTFRAARATVGPKKRARVVCVHSMQRASRRKGKLYKATKDVDCFDPVTKKWRSYSESAFKKHAVHFDGEGVASTPHIVGPTQQAESHAPATPTFPSPVLRTPTEKQQQPSTDADADAGAQTGPEKAPTRVRCHNADAKGTDESRFRFTIDKSLRSDGDVVSLRRISEDGEEVLYRVSRPRLEVEERVADGVAVESVLVNSFIAVPRLFPLYYPDV